MVSLVSTGGPFKALSCPLPVVFRMCEKTCADNVVIAGIPSFVFQPIHTVVLRVTDS